MQNAKVDVLIVQFAYGGNGGVSSTIPQLAEWMTKTVIKMKGDERIGRIKPIILSDTPITMTRNRAIRIAKDEGYDMVLMLDSDNEPDGYVGTDPDAKPFWDVSFSFAYDRLVKGTPTCIFAPYCGPPPHPVHDEGFIGSGEVPYLFHWMDNESDDPNPQRKLEMLTRNEAAKLTGIWPMAAGPTGVCLFTTTCFLPLKVPYFYYEWNEDHSEKMSTEDVVATRNISLYWQMTEGVDVCFAACDSWALHYKPKKVGKPRVTPVEAMAKSFRDALDGKVSAREKKSFVDYTDGLNLSEPIVSGSMQPLLNTQQELQDVGNAVAVALADPIEKQNGQLLKYRMVGGRKVAAIQTEISDESIDNIAMLTDWLVEKKDGPLEVAVAHAGSGQSAAAILHSLPDGSHLYALDSTLTYQFSTEPSDQFVRSFQPELESGRVMADLSGRKFPYPENAQHLDLVFIERSLTEEKLDTWYGHLTEGGLLAGLGYENPKFSRMVDEFVENNGLKLTAKGDVWAIPK